MRVAVSFLVLFRPRARREAKGSANVGRSSIRETGWRLLQVLLADGWHDGDDLRRGLGPSGMDALMNSCVSA